jgi:hypothetical protein
VIDPSNPEPPDTDANEIPFSAAIFLANGDANTLSEEVAAVDEGTGAKDVTCK